MADELFVITGATGNIGKAATQILLERGKRVRVVGRRADRLEPLARAGAEAFTGSLDNPTAMRHAFEGATGVFAMIPPQFEADDFRAYQNGVGEALAAGIEQSSVSHVVFLSSVGAHQSEGTGPILGLHDQEKRFGALDDPHVVNLRAAFFMENHLNGIGIIKQMGIAGSPLAAELSLPMIATRDIAATVAELLMDRSWSGKSTRELLGPREYTMTETTRILGAAISRPDLSYSQFPYEEAEKAMLGMGMSANVAATMTELYRGINEGRVVATERRSLLNTTPTTMEEFGKTFAAAFNAA